MHGTLEAAPYVDRLLRRGPAGTWSHIRKADLSDAFAFSMESDPPGSGRCWHLRHVLGVGVAVAYCGRPLGR
jgi:hypothetical protein